MSHVPWQGDLARSNRTQDVLKALKKSSLRRWRFWIGLDEYSALNLIVTVAAIATLWFSPPYLGDFGRRLHSRITDFFRFRLAPECFQLKQPNIINPVNP